ncbi:MAG: flavoprotein [Actinobacteria bacterium 13_1_20CM_3_71_11]|nr:MAG: flavoprotein [Actinobacteria bacterium 13_1_20CM_3_71_11]TML22094.1 MAG: flavoprotein [Actinomycetota bacterium]
MSDKRRVLYIATCATPAATQIGTLIELAQQAGWTTCVLVTPNALNFVDVPALEAQTGYPVRCHYRRPDEVSPFPKADGIILAGASFNTLNKWAFGITDTLVLSTVAEAVGLGTPVVLMPFFNNALGVHPAWRQSVETLRGIGVTVLVSPDIYEPHAPGAGDEILKQYPWRLALKAIAEKVP